MDYKSKNLKLTYRKLTISDYREFSKLFYHCFKKKISLDFFKWRYLSRKSSFCYGAFASSKLIANVGIISMKLNNHKNNEIIFSRHSSMVLKKFRGNKIYSELLRKVKKRFFKKIKFIVTWPNKNNHSNFNMDDNKVIKNFLYLYEASYNTKKYIKKMLPEKTKNYSIDDLIRFKDLIKNHNSFFLKNYIYLKNRYLLYNKQDYLINELRIKNYISFFILKSVNEKQDTNYIILDHFGSNKIKSIHFRYLIAEKKKLTFISKKKINDLNFKLLNCLNFKIVLLKNNYFKQAKNFIINKEIFLGDTDIFITL